MSGEKQTLVVDPKRANCREVGIFVRAMVGQRWGSVDIAHLSKESLLVWLADNPRRPAQVVLLLLGHQIP